MPSEARNPQPALDTRNLRIGYPRTGTDLCDPLSFAILPGTLTAIIGINGVGKSTLLRTLSGLQPALGGQIRVAGRNLDEIPAGERALQLSVVLTAPPASGNLNVAELVALGRHPHTNWIGKRSESDRNSIAEAIGRMELGGLQERYCHTLSDGQLQRALIARALAQDTPLMLLDEPTSHLDLYHKVRILKALRAIAHEPGRTVVFTTHELDLAIQLCDRLLILTPEGARTGTPEELIRDGAFDALFPDDTIRFHPESGRFGIAGESRGSAS